MLETRLYLDQQFGSISVGLQELERRKNANVMNDFSAGLDRVIPVDMVDETGKMTSCTLPENYLYVRHQIPRRDVEFWWGR